MTTEAINGTVVPVRRRSIGWAAYIFAASAALQIVARVADGIGLSGFIAEASRIWRAFSHVLWADLFARLRQWFDLAPSSSEMDALTLTVLVALTAAFSALKRIVPPIRDIPNEPPTEPSRREALFFGACLAGLYLLFVWPTLVSYLRGVETWRAIGIGAFTLLFLQMVFLSGQMLCYSRPLFFRPHTSVWSYVRAVLILGYFGGMLWSSMSIGFGNSPFSVGIAVAFTLSVFALIAVRPQALTAMCIVAVVLLTANLFVELLQPISDYIRGALTRADA